MLWYNSISPPCLSAYVPLSQQKTHYNCYFFVILWPFESAYSLNKFCDPIYDNTWPNLES